MNIYQKEYLIGKGSYGRVYACKNTKTGEDVAIKSMPLIENGLLEVNTCIEATLLTHLEHPNIMKPKDIIMNNNNIYIVMPLIKRTLDVVDKNIIYKILLALEYLHKNNIIHRDIKPSNILYDGYNPIIIDFSLSVLNMGQKLTHEVYTTAYRAPEITQGKQYSYNADIYALGISLRFLLDKNYHSHPLHDIIESMLQSNPYRRPNASDLLKHPIFSEFTPPPSYPIKFPVVKYACPKDFGNLFDVVSNAIFIINHKHSPRFSEHFSNFINYLTTMIINDSPIQNRPKIPPSVCRDIASLIFCNIYPCIVYQSS